MSTYDILQANDERESYWQSVQDWSRMVFPLYLWFWGKFSSTSACLHPFRLRQMHQKQCEIFQDSADEKLEGYPVVTAIIGGIVGLIAGLAMTATSGPGSSTDLGGWANVPVMMAVVAGIGGAMGFGLAARERFKRVYVRALVLQYADPVDDWKVTHTASVPVPRLAFCADRRNFYFGPTEASGVRNAQVVLLAAYPRPEGVDMDILAREDGTPYTRDIRQCSVRDLFDLPPASGTWTGTNASWQYSINVMVREAAALDREMQQKKGAWLNKENVLILALGLAAAAGTLNIMSLSGQAA